MRMVRWMCSAKLQGKSSKQRAEREARITAKNSPDRGLRSSPDLDPDLG